MADGTRMADKLKNAFAIELQAYAQQTIAEYAPNALPLTTVSVEPGPQSGVTTYETNRDTNKKFWWAIAAVGAIFFLLAVR